MVVLKWRYALQKKCAGEYKIEEELMIESNPVAYKKFLVLVIYKGQKITLFPKGDSIFLEKKSKLFMIKKIKN